MSWKIERTIPSIPVPNLAAGIEFYSLLGFEHQWSWPSEDPGAAGMHRGDAEVMLQECNPFERIAVYFVVDDIQKCYDLALKGLPWQVAERLGQLGGRDDCPPASALQQPAAPSDEVYGYREFSVVDPWGHEITFGMKLDD